jgi:type II secretory ATPase GspE/PulE/Tfp pilus assembly ATPase PilB-like protein
MPSSEKGKEITAEVHIPSTAVFANLTSFKEKINELSGAVASATTFLENILRASLDLNASDVHFEPEKEKVRLRFRIDGLLYAAADLPSEIYELLVNRIKLLAGLKLNVRQAAQDGRFTVSDGEDIEIRVSINPSEFGETTVLRVLNPITIGLGLTDLGFRQDDETIVRAELAKPNGMILVTGPTGSGKTTTLYAFLKEVRTPEIKIITIEDPIEYHLSGVEQTQVDPEAGYDFENGLRSLMRQDPDVILVGEIRDSATVEIASQASLTGHLVFSTLHTNDAVGAIPRLLVLEVKPATIGPALNLVIAQRLVRRLCPKCRQEIELAPELRRKIEELIAGLPERVEKGSYSSPRLYRPVGCEFCESGYKGRIGIYELFEVGRDLDPLITEELTETAIFQAIKSKFVPLQVDGILKAIAGLTSFEEVERITGPLVWKI